MTSISCLPQMKAFWGMQTMSLPIWFLVQMSFNPKVQMCLWMVKDFHKEWIFMIVGSHKSREIDVPLYTYT